jgi:hypothetical protein
MTTFISILALVALVSGLVALIHFVRQDHFAGPGSRTIRHDEVGQLAFRRRPA